MIVVSNTSPLTNLAAIGRFEFLRDLYHELHIAEGVWLELNAGGRDHPGSNEVAKSAWVQRHTISKLELVMALSADLDLGEAEAIALALELDADLLLMDEQAGRRHAQRLGIRTLGVVGLLIEAKAAGLLKEIRPSLIALVQDAGFYLSDAVIQRALFLAGEESYPAGG